MAGLAALHLHWLMLEYKWASLVCVARKASNILSSRCTDLTRSHRAVGIVAVAALDQALVYSVMERHLEFGLLIEMARITKRGLGLYEEEFPCRSMVRRMTSNATDIVLCVN